MCQWARRLSRVKLAVTCGARSALRRTLCSNCERCRERIHCSANIVNGLTFMFRAKRQLYLRHFSHRRDSRDGRFWPATEKEDSRISHKLRQTSWNFARGGKVVRASHRLGGGVGGWEGERGTIGLGKITFYVQGCTTTVQSIMLYTNIIRLLSMCVCT